MTKNKRVAVYVEEEWSKALAGLAGTFGVSADEVVRLSLPDEAVIGLFFQCKDYLPELRWDEVADVGRVAIREHLRAIYMKGLEGHLARLGVGLDSSAGEVEAARQHALGELKADTAHPLRHQIAKAEEDSVYLGRLYDAWKRAQAGRPGYTIAQVDVKEAANAPKNTARNAGKVWAVLKDDRIV
jgi:hypothetical protein